MNSLVAYGSNSDSSDDEGGDNCIVGQLVNQKPKQTEEKAGIESSSLLTEDDFDAVESGGNQDAADSLLGTLPAMTEALNAGNITTETGLEDFVTETKPWEVKLREKAEAKRQKLIAKRDKNSPTAKKSKGKVKIPAFAVKPVDEYDEEDDVTEMPTQEKKSIPGHGNSSSLSGLLSVLPAPKKSVKGKASNSQMFDFTMRPRTVPKKAEVVQPSNLPPTTTSIHTEQESDSDDELPSDFFGLSADPKRAKLDASASAEAATDFKIKEEEPERASSSGTSSRTRPANARDITDEKAFDLIYRNEMQPWGVSDRNAAEAVGNMVEVNMNARNEDIDVRATLLRNLNNRGVAEMAATITSTGPKPKATRDVNSKRKHQITYLAELAVARDEQLREQWSQNRQTKRLTKQKYGF
ncbi:hypothetical protein QR680_010479 [Steinernema hermaphroditum]|uniref:Proline-rich protein PRCC n=1 Tax=Steinernema hermaphroditum TaxID=289476 RepID=A0AA39MAS5_9BILA|nr:hypothetical protein QR680_010479 [Steinernema hermaphroditum]